MANDENGKPTEGSGDLKARLSFGAKSRRAQIQEEERRASEAAVAAKDEAEKKKERDDQFSLAGSGPEAEPAWAPIDVSEAELKQLESLPKKGRGVRIAVVLFIAVLALALAVVAGFFVGQGDLDRKMRALDVEEAKRFDVVLNKDSESHFKDAVAYARAIEKLQDEVAAEEDPDKKVELFLEFYSKVEAFYNKHCDSKLVSEAAFFGGKKETPRDAKLVLQVRAYLTSMEAVDRTTLKFKTALEGLGGVAMATGANAAANDPSAVGYVMFQPDVWKRKVEDSEVSIPWNKGWFVKLQGEPAAETQEDGRDLYKAKVKQLGSADAEALSVETSYLAAVDTSPVLSPMKEQMRQLNRNFALVMATQYLKDLREATSGVNEISLRELLSAIERAIDPAKAQKK